jgi:hypothetical protein
MFASLRNNFFYYQTCSLCFASLDSQFNINLFRFTSIFKFFNINMFASLRNQFSNYRTSSLRFAIEKNIIIEAFDCFASISMPLKGHGNEVDFLGFCDSKLLPWPIFCQIGPLKAWFSCLKFGKSYRIVPVIYYRD